MALRWRIRYKLWLGFGLVIAIIGLLLAGTFYGLWSYRSTRQAINDGLIELEKADNLGNQIKELYRRGRNDPDVSKKLGQRLAQVRSTIDQFEQGLSAFDAERMETDTFFEEASRIEWLKKHLKKLEERYDLYRNDKLPNTVVSHGPRLELVEEPVFREALDNLDRDAGDLKSVIVTSLENQNENGRTIFYRVLYWVVGTCGVGILLVMGLFRRYYVWVVRPVRDLQKGVDRVAQGDFEHRIQVASGDEMEELAARFNHMTDELRSLYDDLEQQVNDRSRQLVRSERLASVGFLAAGVAHEINNPLASIAFCSEALESRLDDVLDNDAGPTLPIRRPPVADRDRETITKYLKMIQDEAFRCKKITQRLLEFSRGGEGKREPTDLNETIQSVMDVVQHLQTGRNKQLVFQPDRQIIAQVNAQEIKSVVLNLVVNALENMDEGGALTISNRLVGDRVEITFRDTGCGMTAEVLENIFEPFYTRSRTGKGTGLGLSISHRIVQQHGGDIKANSAGKGQGSTFVIQLPLQPPEDAPLPTGEEAPEDLFRRQRRAA